MSIWFTTHTYSSLEEMGRTLVVPLAESCLGEGKMRGAEGGLRKRNVLQKGVMQHETQVDG